VAAELRSLADPAPWRLVLSFEISRSDPRPSSVLAGVRSAAAVDPEADTAEMLAVAGDVDGGIDLAEDLPPVDPDPPHRAWR
jgi:hypothetical protein